MRTFSKASKRIKFTCSFLCLLLGSAADAAIVRYDFTGIGQSTTDNFLFENNRWTVKSTENFKDGTFSGSFIFDTSKMPVGQSAANTDYFGPGSGAWLTSVFNAPGYTVPTPFSNGLSSPHQMAVIPMAQNLGTPGFDSFSASASAIEYDTYLGDVPGGNYFRTTQSSYNFLAAHPITKTDIIDGIEFPSHWGPLNVTTQVSSHDLRENYTYINGNLQTGSKRDQSIVTGTITSLARMVIDDGFPPLLPLTAAPTPIRLIGEADFDPLNPTIVITHGWQPDSDGSDPAWVSKLASQIKNVDLQNKPVNVIEVYWDDAKTDFYYPADLRKATAQVGFQGQLLGDRLRALPGSFEGGIQFIGHSLGNLVNAYAANGLTSTGQTVDQFTILERPFGRGFLVDSIFPVGGDIDQNIFRSLLPKDLVVFVDNYFGDDGTRLPFRTGAAFDSDVVALNHVYNGANHTDIQERYLQTIQAGQSCSSEGGFDCSILMNGLNRPTEQKWDPGSSVFRPIGNPIYIDPITWSTFNCTINTIGQDVSCSEGSPAYLWKENFKIDEFADFLSFEFRWDNLGDGDWLTLFFDDELLFSYTGSAFEGGNFISSGWLPIKHFAGQSGQLLFSLNSVGESNASFTVRNVGISALSQAVPEPATWGLLLVGFAAAGYRLRHGSRNFSNART